MSSLQRQLERARAHVRVEWTEARTQRVLHGAARTRRRRVAILAAAAAGFAAGIVAGGAVIARQRQSAQGAAIAGAGVAGDGAGVAVARTSAPAPLRFDDGSIVLPTDAASAVRALEVSPRRIVVELLRGSARCDVVHRAGRVFQIKIGDVTVTDLGTELTVARTAEGADVAVERGRVRVAWSDGSVELGAGERGSFPPPAPRTAAAATPAGAGVAGSPAAAPLRTRPTAAPPVADGAPSTLSFDDEPAPDEGTSAAAAGGAAAAAPAADDWRRLANAGEMDQAFAALERQGDRAVGDDPGDLLLAADAARLSHHPAQAVAPLRQLLGDHQADPRAPLAAFTLGRVLLDELGDPRAAADAFEQAYASDPAGSLAEDALARAVEAWSRAGESGRAHDAAERYLGLYPAGRRLRTVRAYGLVK